MHASGPDRTDPHDDRAGLGAPGEQAETPPLADARELDDATGRVAWAAATSPGDLGEVVEQLLGPHGRVVAESVDAVVTRVAVQAVVHQLATMLARRGVMFRGCTVTFEPPPEGETVPVVHEVELHTSGIR